MENPARKMTLLFDGKYFLYRSLNANIVLTHNDIVTTTYYTFLNSIKSVTKKFDADNVIILWDSKYSYRKEIFSGYKQKDLSKDENLRKQLEIIQAEYDNIKFMMYYLGFASYLRYGLEADDLFALYCQQYRFKEDIIIVSKDEDLYQLLHERVKMYDPKNKKTKDRKWFIKEYGITPEYWGLFKAIAGCKSDKIPGIKGIGDETALKYLRKGLKDTKRIKENQPTIDFFLPLTLLPFQSPGQRKTLTLRPKYTDLKMDRFEEICMQMGFKSFMENLEDWHIFTRNQR